MRIWYLLLTLIAATGLCSVPGADSAPDSQTELPSAERCLSSTPPDDAPWVFEAGRGYVECIRVEQAAATFSNTYPVNVSLDVLGQQEDTSGSPVQVEQWRDGNTLFITIYRPGVETERSLPATYQQTIPLDGPFEAGTYTVHINNVSFEIVVPDAPPPGEDAYPPYEGNTPPAQFSRSYAVIEDVEVLIRPGYPPDVTLIITGYHGDGCALPIHIDQAREGRQIIVEIYRLIDPAMACPLILTRLDETVRLEGVLERGTYQLRVNDYELELAMPGFPPGPPRLSRSSAVIETVEVLLRERFSYPPRLTLHVTGYHPTGCEAPLQIEQSRRGNRVLVEIYTLLSPAALCPQMLLLMDEYIPLDGSFEYGTYIIQVNDYTFRYSLPPMYYDRPLDDTNQ